MGKGYNNYMCKKPFHPGSKANIKRTWMAEQRTENEKKKQDDLKVQYEKEQELYNNRAMISTESKDKLELNFMYEAPPGAKRERQKEDDEPEYKFEWQRKYNAPREDFAKGNTEIRDQPFGIPVRNVRCIKCHKWGHINTDKECPLFSQASTSSMPTTSMDPLELMRQMREDGYNLKQSVLGHHLNPQAANQQLLESEEEDPEVEFLKSLSSKQKHKLLKKLNKITKKKAKGGSSCNKKKKSKKKHKTKRKSESESENEKGSKKKRAKKVAKKSDTKSLNIDYSDSSDSADNKEENVSMQSTKKAVHRAHKNSNSSAGSDSGDEKTKEEGGRDKSAAQSSKDEYTGANSKEEKRKKIAASKIGSLKHNIKEKAKRDPKDHSSEGSGADKFSAAEDRINTDVKEEAKVTPSKSESKRIEMHIKQITDKDIPSKHDSKRIECDAKEKEKVTPSKHESKKIETHIKQDLRGTLSKHKMKRKSSESSSDSGSSSSESSLEDYRSKRVKHELERDSSPIKGEPSDSGAQKIIIDITKPSCSKSHVETGVTTACLNEVSNSPEHPDRFTCSTPPPPPEPQASETSNLATILLERKYLGDKDEKFRRINRDRRSPSFKQKYRLT